MDNGEPRPRQIESIKRSDMKPDAPQPGGTLMMFQRHEAYNKSGADRGALTDEGRARALQQSHDLMRNILEQIPEAERDSVSVMVLASPTHLGEGQKQRAVETAEEVLRGVKQAFQEEGIAEFRPLNDQERFGKNAGKPIVSEKIVEPKIFDETNKAQEPYFLWLNEHTGGKGVGPDLFTAFEADEGEVREKRMELGGEGPLEMAERIDAFLSAMKLYSDKFHQANPGRRLILWPVSHYDVISPWVKTRLNKEGLKRFLEVETGSGFSVNITPDKKTSAKVGDERYDIPLVKASTAS